MANTSQNTDDLECIARQVRKQFERHRICPALLCCLYQSYHPLPDVIHFVQQAEKLFPHSNCGLTSIYLQQLLNDGDIIRGSYAEHGHTFLLLDRSLAVDITADQFGGPEVYIGPVKKPWSLKNGFTNVSKITNNGFLSEVTPPHASTRRM